jgi:hypothetical protein
VPNIGSAPVANPPLVRPSTLEETLAKFRKDLDQSFFEKYGVKAASRVYHKPYPEYFDALPYPQGYKVPDFAKFNGVDSKTTWEHVSQYLAQLGEAGNSDPLKVRLFPLSLTGTTFSWFSALPYGSINTWYHLEKNFTTIFIVVIMSLSCHILHRLSKSMMNRSPITSRGLGILRIDVIV